MQVVYLIGALVKPSMWFCIQEWIGVFSSDTSNFEDDQAGLLVVERETVEEGG